MERILLFTERSIWGSLASTVLSAVADVEVTHLEWSFGDDPDPRKLLRSWRGDYVIAFKADARVPATLLDRCRGSVNFHPGPPWYRGVASADRAISNGDSVFGVTLHSMDEQLDSGRVLDVRTFPISAGSDVSSLRVRTGAEMLSQLYDQISRRECWPGYSAGSPRAATPWSGGLYSLRQARDDGLIH